MNLYSFVAAASNSGKTTLIEKIVRVLKAEGLRVAVIKHASEGFDANDTDLNKYLRSGAEAVVLAARQNVTVIRNLDAMPSIEEMQRAAGDADMTIYEGFKADARNKIEVFRYGVSGTRPLCLEDSSFIALVSDKIWDTTIPQFDLNDVESITRFLIERCESLKLHLGGCNNV